MKDESGAPAKQGSIPSDARMPLLLLNDGHVPWHVHGDQRRGEPVVYVRGYAASGERFFENQELAKHVQQLAVRGAQVLHEEIPKFNGGWAMVVAWPSGQVLAAVDRMRTVPLFFYHNNQCLAIAASGAELAQRFSLPLSVAGQLKFLLFGYVSGAGTLYEDVRQIQSGEIVEFSPTDRTRPTATRYYRFYPSTVSRSSEEELSAELAQVIGRMFERFRDGYRGERIGIPLSGGLDSRLIAGMLKRMGIDNCFCYTYGDASSEESQVSRRVAESLGFPWRCFQHSPELFGEWDGSEVYREFVRYAGKGVARPNDHDFIGVMQLADEGFCGPEAIYFPGHSADMNAGSHIPPDYPDLYSGTLSVVDEIVRHHSNPLWYEPLKLLKSTAGQSVLKEIEQEVAVPAGAGLVNNLACCEMWNAEQRQSKYIINSVRAYEFVGARWRTLWDYEFMDFFLRVPDDLRYGERLYLDCLGRHIFVDDLAQLAEIPVPEQGPVTTIGSIRDPVQTSTAVSRLRTAIKRRVRWQLLKAGLENPRISGKDHLVNSAVRLQGRGVADGNVSFGDALDRAGVRSALTPESCAAIAPWLSLRLDSTPWLAVFTVLALAEMSQSDCS